MSSRVVASICLLSVLLAAPVVAAPAPATSDATPHRIALQMIGDYPRVQVHVEGIDRPLSFVVDTAAGATLIDVALAEASGLFDAPDDGGVKVTGAGGSGGSVRRTGLRDLHAGNFHRKTQMLAMDLSALARPGVNPADGVLGNDLMAAFDLRFDLPAGEMLLAQPGSLPRSGCLDNALPERAANIRQFPFVEAQMRDGARQSPATVLVDTGAARSVLNVVAARALGLEAGDARLRRSNAVVGGVSGDFFETSFYTLPSLQIGAWQRDAHELLITEMPVLHQLGLTDRPALILGIDALRDTRVDVLANAEAVCFGPQGSDDPDAASTAPRTDANGMAPAR